MKRKSEKDCMCANIQVCRYLCVCIALSGTKLQRLVKESKDMQSALVDPWSYQMLQRHTHMQSIV